MEARTYAAAARAMLSNIKEIVAVPGAGFLPFLASGSPA